MFQYNFSDGHWNLNCICFSRAIESYSPFDFFWSFKNVKNILSWRPYKDSGQDVAQGLYSVEFWFRALVLYYYFFIYWDIVALQHCAIFFCTMKWISYMYTYIQAIKPVNLKGNQRWIFIGKTDAEAEAPILWPSDAKNWLIGKAPDAGKDWRQEEKGMTEDEMVWWHHRLDGPEFEQAPGVGDGQGSLACCSP